MVDSSPQTKLSSDSPTISSFDQARARTEQGIDIFSEDDQFLHQPVPGSDPSVRWTVDSRLDWQSDRAIAVGGMSRIYDIHDPNPNAPEKILKIANRAPLSFDEVKLIVGSHVTRDMLRQGEVVLDLDKIGSDEEEVKAQILFNDLANKGVDPHQLRAFREAAFLHRFVQQKRRHPNIVKIYGGMRFFASTDENGQEVYVPAMVLEKVGDGTTAHEMLAGVDQYSGDERRVYVNRMMKLLEGPAGALQTMHDNGIIHRDFKPGNLLLEEENGVPKRLVLGDLGLSLLGSDTIGTAFGTPEYISPEQALQSGWAVKSSDTYALGLMCAEFMAGRNVLTRNDYEFPTQKALSTMSDEPFKATLLQEIHKKCGLPLERAESVANFLNLVCNKDIEQRIESPVVVIRLLKDLTGNNEILAKKAQELIRLFKQDRQGMFTSTYDQDKLNELQQQGYLADILLGKMTLEQLVKERPQHKSGSTSRVLDPSLDLNLPKAGEIQKGAPFSIYGDTPATVSGNPKTEIEVDDVIVGDVPPVEVTQPSNRTKVSSRNRLQEFLRRIPLPRTKPRKSA